MDNHGAHRSLLTTAYLKEIGLEVLWIPAYASELNPVEWIWKLFKDAWHKDMFRRYLSPDAPQNRNETTEEIKGHVMRLLEPLTTGHYNYCHGRLRTLAKLAKEVLETF